MIGSYRKNQITLYVSTISNVAIRVSRRGIQAKCLLQILPTHALRESSLFKMSGSKFCYSSIRRGIKRTSKFYKRDKAGIALHRCTIAVHRKTMLHTKYENPIRKVSRKTILEYTAEFNPTDALPRAHHNAPMESIEALSHGNPSSQRIENCTKRPDLRHFVAI